MPFSLLSFGLAAQLLYSIHAGRVPAHGTKVNYFDVQVGRISSNGDIEMLIITILIRAIVAHEVKLLRAQSQLFLGECLNWHILQRTDSELLCRGMMDGVTTLELDNVITKVSRPTLISCIADTWPGWRCNYMA